MGILILAVGCAIPAMFLLLFSHPTRLETDDEWMDRVFTKHPRGKKRLRQRVPEHGYSKRPAKRTARRRKSTRR